MPLPPAFVERLRAVVPRERVAGGLATFAAPEAVGFGRIPLRVAAEGTDTGAVTARLQGEGLAVQAVEGVPGAYAVPAEERAALLASAPYAEGLVYLQNVSSQLPVLALDPQPGERVLDLCAAPGSKTGQIAALMEDEGELVAVEKVRDRFFRLRANVAAQGATLVHAVLGSGTAFWHREPESFDRVLLDAPCSTEGRFRADDPETTRYWSERKVKEMRGKQERLLFAAVQALRPGGTLVYSTCTFAPEENEAVVDRALRTFGDAVEVVEAGLPTTGPAAAAQPGIEAWGNRTFRPEVALTRRILPDGALEAFYLARLVKHASTVRG